MEYIEKYNKEKDYYFQDGRIADYIKLKELYPAIDDLTYIVHTDYTGKIIYLFELLDVRRTELNIDASLNDDQAIAKILEIMNTPKTEIDDQTRMADALEDLVVLNMPDEEV